ncbi:MAG: hypothetical protein ACYTEE_09950 [Planctomycetota bacterium]|jgi:hypothetical protein
MLLDKIKTSLEKLYDIDTGVNIDDYLSKDDNTPGNDGSVNVLLDSEETVLWLNIQLHPRYSKILQDESFVNKLTRKNILHYYILTEEVSHFVYLFWKCGINDISPSDISRQELELQGKIDRYILLMDSFMRQNEGETPGWMKSILFDKLPHRFESHPEEIYAKANLFAKKYCSIIEHNFIMKRDIDGLLKDVRTLYNYNEKNKLNHIARSRFIH